MPTRLLLDGPAIAPLLARVHAEHGDQARIVRAERVRTGGIGGFFARQRFEVTVEVPGGEAGDTAARGVEDLLDAADAGDAGFDLSSAVPAPRRPAEVPSADVPPAGTPEPETVPVRFADVLTSLDDARPVGLPPSAVPSPVPSPAPGQPPEPAGGPRRRGGPRHLAAPTEVSVLSALGVPDEVLAASAPGSVVPQLPALLRRLPAAPPTRLPNGGVVAVVGSGRPVWDAAAVLARRLGLDDSAVLYATTASAAVPAGHRLAGQRLAGVADAARRADGSRSRQLPAVVVLDVEVRHDDERWARDVLDALAPDQVWAVVDATRKLGDVRRHLDALTGRTGLDALAVHGTAETVDPASVLALGVPVGLLDGRPATAGAWTALLLDRLEDLS